MIVLRVKGGLGNQLFCYAAARALSLRTGSELVLDTSTGFTRDYHRHQYYLQHFRVEGRTARPWESLDFPAGRAVRHVLRKASKLVPPSRRPFLTEASAHFDPGVLGGGLKRFTYMEGYFQCERYFADFATTIRGDLSVASPLSPRTLELGEEIRSTKAVSIHVRRLYGVPAGTNLPPIASVPALGQNYYQGAMDSILREIPDAEFFVFADYPEWARNNLRSRARLTFVDHNKGHERAFEDLYLMSLCKHHILANSTFSWWGAWLAETPNQIVYAPRMFNFGESDDIIPTRWRVLDPRSLAAPNLAAAI